MCEGGYDYAFVSDRLSDSYTCYACKLAPREAQRTACCRTVFCKQYLDKLTNTECNPVCPRCGKGLENDYLPDKRVIHCINRRKVYCDNRGLGCMWKGELRRADTHHNQCPHRIVSCPNHCKNIVQSKHLPQHLQEQCNKRQTRCTYCGLVGLYFFITADHLNMCPDYRINCPNKGCCEKPKRKDMELHCRRCPKKMVSCRYADLGCDHMCPRDDMLKHNTKNVHSHLHLTTERLRVIRTHLESKASVPQKHIIKMTSFTELKASKRSWYSPPFYIFPGGYNMSLKVDVGGTGSAEGNHVSVFLYLVEGKNDEFLDWPLRGEFAIKLLNQESNENHIEGSVNFFRQSAVPYNSRVRKGWASGGYGIIEFVSHQDLENKPHTSHIQYLKDNTLYFQVVMMKTPKPWLMGVVS